MFLRISGSDNGPEGECPKCQKIVFIGESICPYCLHEFSEAELSSLKRQASELNEISKSQEKLWFIVMVATIVIALFFAV